jgi:hypothetical protein
MNETPAPNWWNCSQLKCLFSLDWEINWSNCGFSSWNPLVAFNICPRDYLWSSQPAWLDIPMIQYSLKSLVIPIRREIRMASHKSNCHKIYARSTIHMGQFSRVYCLTLQLEWLSRAELSISQLMMNSSRNVLRLRSVSTKRQRIFETFFGAVLSSRSNLTGQGCMRKALSLGTKSVFDFQWRRVSSKSFPRHESQISISPIRTISRNITRGSAR